LDTISEAAAMKYYPLYMNLEGQKCLIVGAGAVAARKARALLECGARVTVVGEDPSAAMRRLEGERLAVRARKFRRSDMGKYALVIGATDDARLNRELFRESRRRGIPVNIVDDPERSTFIVPAVHRQGDLALAVSTGGKSPAAARLIREDLEKRYGSDYAAMIDLLGAHREEMMKSVHGHRRRAAAWKGILAEDLVGALRRKGRSGAAALIRRHIRAAAEGGGR
jgi:precorrin-2 dehydrogenase/sirohydrochlorin ferrochelatase